MLINENERIRQIRFFIKCHRTSHDEANCIEHNRIRRGLAPRLFSSNQYSYFRICYF